jgi:hypothetical protein
MGMAAERYRSAIAWAVVWMLFGTARADVVLDVVSCSTVPNASADFAGEYVSLLAYKATESSGTGLLLGLGPGPTKPPGVSSPWSFGIRATPLNATMGIAFAWYQAAVGDRFDADAAAATSPLATNLEWPVGTVFDPMTIGGFSDEPVALPREFYLASWARWGVGDQPDGDDFYTWARLQLSFTSSVGYELTVLESAISRGGIMVGQAVGVPEPAAFSLSMMCLAAIALRTIASGRMSLPHPRYCRCSAWRRL